MNEKYKRLLKFAAIALVIVAVTVGVAVLSEYIRYRRSPEYQIQQAMRDLERRYAEDTYGGSTPEETLQLFIDALEKGDVESASKYFVLDKQEEWRKDLVQLKERGMLKNLISDLERMVVSKKEDTAFFTLVDENNFAISEIIIRKNIYNNRWKIEEF